MRNLDRSRGRKRLCTYCSSRLCTYLVHNSSILDFDFEMVIFWYIRVWLLTTDHERCFQGFDVHKAMNNVYVYTVSALQSVLMATVLALPEAKDVLLLFGDQSQGDFEAST